jgi:hypothetical protein
MSPFLPLVVSRVGDLCMPVSLKRRSLDGRPTSEIIPDGKCVVIWPWHEPPRQGCVSRCGVVSSVLTLSQVYYMEGRDRQTSGGSVK